MAHSARINARFAQDRQHEINMRRLQFEAAQLALDQQRAQTERQRSGVGGANQFLGQWNQYMQEARGMYNRALGAYERGFDYLGSAERNLGQLGQVSQNIMDEYRSFQSEFGPLTQALSDEAMTDMSRRRELGAQFMDLARADYEGAAGRAMAEVSQQANIARQSEARRLQRLGIDPTSMRSRGVSARMAGQEATGRALAGNIARRQEMQRVAGMTQAGMQLFDPNRMATTALNIRQAGSALLGQTADIARTEAMARAQMGSTAAQMAQGMGAMGGSFAQTVGGQAGDLAGLMLGLQYGTGGGPPQMPAAAPATNYTMPGGVSAGGVYGGATQQSPAMRAYNAPRVWDADYQSHYNVNP